MVKEDGLYIAGPECFYPNGYNLWFSKRRLAEYKGIRVYMPTSTNLELSSIDLRENAHIIMDDLLKQAEKCSAIIANLESFRSTEPDGGTVFELGMMYAKGARLYGYAPCIESIARRDRSLWYGYRGERLDELGNQFPYGELPFSPNIAATTRLVEGDFSTTMGSLLEDLRQQRMAGSSFVRRVKLPPVDQSAVFISSPERYSQNAKSIRINLIERFKAIGLRAVFPDTFAPGDDCNRQAALLWKRTQKKILSCAYFLADLSDFRGYEPSTDVAFETGYAFAMQKHMHAIMPDIRTMRQRIPNIDGLDGQGNIVENFDYPINLMFSCSIPRIIEGTIAEADRAFELSSSL